MEDLQFWKIDRKNKDLVETIKESFDDLYSRRPSGYQFGSGSEDVDFNPINSRVYFVVGTNLDNLLGYAECHEGSPSKDIGKVSRLSGLGCGSELSDFEGNKVSRKNLAEYDGYSSYKGLGKVLHIGFIDIFKRGNGYENRLLEFIKSQNYELIESEADGTDQIKFFEANGFIDTGIDEEDGAYLVMVWNNPNYAK